MDSYYVIMVVDLLLLYIYGAELAPTGYVWTPTMYAWWWTCSYCIYMVLNLPLLGTYGLLLCNHGGGFAPTVYIWC